MERAARLPWSLCLKLPNLAWQRRQEQAVNMTQEIQRTCFVMMPFAGEFDDIYRHVIAPSIEAAGYRSVRADQLSGTGPILREIIRQIERSDLLIVDVSKANPNVYYELGIAHALAKRAIIISSDVEDVPFDLRQYRVLPYDASNLSVVEKFRDRLVEAIREAAGKR